jgi:hypothetical protein
MTAGRAAALRVIIAILFAAGLLLAWVAPTHAHAAERPNILHAKSVQFHDGTLFYSIRDTLDSDRRGARWLDAVGGDHRRSAIGRGVCHRRVR